MIKTNILGLFYLFYIRLLYWTSGQIQDSVEQSDIDKVHLYHYPNPWNTSERYDLGESMQNANINRGKRMKIVVHGAGGNCMRNDGPFQVIRAYLRAKASGREDYNVLCLDYGHLSRLGPFPGDMIYDIRIRYEHVCDTVSEEAVSLILALEANGYVANLKDIHIIGQSLGGQVSGYIGRKIQEKTGKSLGRITGLDIANILILYNYELNLHKHLDLTDATFVDIICTSPIGLKGDYGHVNFYPDGGYHQRSCLNKGPVLNVKELIIGACSHLIVGKYWANSIDAPYITACKDDSWESFQKKKSDGCNPNNRLTFGEYVPTQARGKYFLEYPLI